MAKYRKKPVVIEAFQYPRLDSHEDGFDAFLEWTDEVGFTEYVTEKNGTLSIKTLEGWMTAQPGDWIIKGVKGEFYPCKPDIFAATYQCEPVTEDLDDVMRRIVSCTSLDQVNALWDSYLRRGVGGQTPSETQTRDKK